MISLYLKILEGVSASQSPEEILGCAYTICSYGIIIIHALELFTSALADGFSLESEWQQVSTSLQDSS